MRCKRNDFSMPLKDLVQSMLEIGVSDNGAVKSFASFRANTLQLVTRYFFNKGARINDHIFFYTCKKHEREVLATLAKNARDDQNSMSAFKKYVIDDQKI